MNDQQGLKFINEQLRPKAETARNLKVELNNLKTVWIDEIQSKVLNDVSDLIEDGRESEGITRLTGVDVYAGVSVLNDIITLMEDPDFDSIVQKLCVRPIQVI